MKKLLICFVLMLRVWWGQNPTTQVGIVIGVSGNGSHTELVVRTIDGAVRVVDYRVVTNSDWVDVKG